MARGRAVSPRRVAAAARTRQAILQAARQLVRETPRAPTVGAIASLAGVSRLSVYHHFGSHAGVLAAVAEDAERKSATDTLDLRALLAAAVAHWAGDPLLFRRVPHPDAAGHDRLRDLATRLAADDRLRPGCSLKEAEDVIAVLMTFEAFDRLHHDGRRSPAAVTEILMRMAGSILSHPT
jgi:AcrR family transcriptional regulator